MITTTANLYRNAFSGLNKRIWLLAVVMFINRSGTMVLPFMTLYCKHIGYTTQQGGWVVAIYGIGSLIGAFMGGRISDRFGFYYTQFFSLLCGGLLFMLLGQMQTYGAICICTFFLSMANEAFRPANATAIAHYSTTENRTQSFSVVRLAINLGWGIGSALGGLLASINYHLLFWVDGVTNISAAILLLIILPKVTLGQQKQQPKEKSVTSKFASPYKDKTFLFFVGFKILFAICFFQLFTTVPLFFKEGLKLNEFWIGVIMSMNGVIIALFEMIIVFKLEGKKPYLVLMTYGAILMALSFFVLNVPLINGFVIASASVLIVTIAEMIALPFMNTFYISRSTEGNRGQYSAIYVMGWSTAQIIGSSTGTLVAANIGFNNLWWLMGGICLVAASGYTWLHKNIN
jgi:predicted MFS family arabinose efflux permease